MKAVRTFFPWVALVAAIALLVWTLQVQEKAPELASSGFTLHIDAKRHVASAPELVVHHYCKPVGDVIECLLFDDHVPDARLIGVEMVISPEAYASMPEAEKANWHYHKTELPLVDPVLPDLSAEEAREVAASLEETYGKVIIFWDPKDPAPTSPVAITVPHSVGLPAAP